ncbi:TPA: helix-turn-helix transcriptional regulator [Enterococcus faecium]|uniref:helix-turn-helix domain-containing protein n=1 Tax=Bacilli TaxID=91061 RepID=UPI001E6088ED|nr:MULTISPECIES: helix-turn-helix transcriptional regulator [Bacilli]MCC9080402.1 helix-turn-helix domain-containing protein [Enterococcus faecium]
MEDLGSKLRELRVKKGYTQEYVARKFNVTRQTISKWENNKTTPDIETLKKFVNFIVLT